MQSFNAVIALAVVLAGTAGCQTARPQQKPDDGMAWTLEQPAPPSNGAIYQAGREVVLAENPVAHHVGDIVTIVLNEATAAQKSATTTTSKSNTLAMPGTQLLGKNVSWLANNLSNSSKFDGEGASAQSNSLTGYLTATVLKVLPNGNLFIAGEKQIGLNQGKEYIRVTGVIRPIDLASDDSIPSYRVASAKITYNGRGAIADANSQSWLSRFFNSPWVPF
ncbi:MAG TPA: flagellar basal body L-ring protein FlgH [Steroidobacteraceae bacterium]|nr:flagellar basal body L-ring protein FlgH [Steroidobacteraceae bacterium]